MIRMPFFHYGLITGNSDCIGKDIHNEHFYDLPAFATLLELRDSMRLMQRYHLEPFMTQRQFFHPRVVVEFYHNKTFRRDRNPIELHFSIDGREGILQASNIAATFNLTITLANFADYRQWPHPLPREIFHILSQDTSVGPSLFRRQLPSRMLFIGHMLRSHLFPLQHLVQMRGSILEALYRI